jgi:DNA-binding NarL/FixJ family response regulator
MQAAECRDGISSSLGMTLLRILVAEDHDIIRAGIRVLIESRSSWKVVAEVSSGELAVTRSAELKPEVVVLDASLPQMSGFAAARKIRKALPETEVVILGDYESAQMFLEAVSCGARGFVVKADAGSDLVPAIRSASRHRFFLGEKLAHYKPYEQTGSLGQKQLSRREQEILQLLAEGWANRDISSRLRISAQTVQTHRNNVMRKLGAHSLADLVRYAIRMGMIQA